MAVLSHDGAAVVSRVSGREQKVTVEAFDEDSSKDSNNLLKYAAPVIAIGATWAVKKIMDKSYQRFTGSPPPRASDRDSGMVRILLWATATAAAIAIVDVVITRIAATQDQSS